MQNVFLKTKDGCHLYYHDVVYIKVEPVTQSSEGDEASSGQAVCGKTNCNSDTEPYVANTECNHESGEEGLEADIRCDLNCEKEALTERLQEIEGLLQALDKSTIRTTLKLLDRVYSPE